MADPKIFNGAGVRWLVDVENGEVMGVLREDDSLQTFGGGGGGGGSGGASITEVSAVNSAGDMQTFKLLDVTVNRTFDVDGVTPLYDRMFGSLLQLDWLEDLGHYVADPASNVFRQDGAISMTWAQAVAIGDAIIATTYTVEDGFRIFVRDIDATMEWNNELAWWRGVNGGPILLKRWLNEATYYAPGSGTNVESTDRVTYTLLGRLMAPNGGKIWARSLCQHVGAGGVKSHRWYLNGGTNLWGSTGPGTAASLNTRAGAVLQNVGSAASQRTFTGGGIDDAGGSATITAFTVNTALDTTVSFRHFLAAGTDQSKYDCLELYLEN